MSNNKLTEECNWEVHPSTYKALDKINSAIIDGKRQIKLMNKYVANCKNREKVKSEDTIELALYKKSLTK
jgi:hypothetical protein